MLATAIGLKKTLVLGLLVQGLAGKLWSLSHPDRSSGAISVA
jgi:hypothetical protein